MGDSNKYFAPFATSIDTIDWNRTTQVANNWLNVATQPPAPQFLPVAKSWDQIDWNRTVENTFAWAHLGFDVVRGKKLFDRRK